MKRPMFLLTSPDGGTRGAMMYVDAMDENRPGQSGCYNTKVSMNSVAHNLDQLSGKVQP